MSFCQEPKVDCQYLKSVIKNLNTRLHILESTNQNCELKSNEVMDQITEDLVIPKLKLNKIQIGFIENNVPQKKVLVTFGNKENFRMDNCDQVGDRIDQNILAINQPSPQKKIITQSLLMSQQLQILKQKDNKLNNINKQPKLKLVKQDSNLIHPIFSKKNSDQQSLGTKFYTRNNSIQSTPVKQIAYNSSLGTTPLRRKNSQKNSDVFINSLQIDDMLHNQSKFLKYFQQNYGSNKQCNTFDNATINLQRRTSLKSQNKITLVDAQIINI
ncbi:unnamed protein product (macronuclear) [Paramecium tetraurelia]|uniref:Uncharacterized protein n=1 Tax=Paramecium tetraurelia TaxID=5888 RepID=A0E0A6_PARTE|nr:uncharacterized protein GSPATT00021891001 [Paramecium tetraurelia]CAK88723.1 unnamed protein product [Paramecium tetraurelia]|eukprot:XP_001456120.1 hypothetical protein (macronuclear) [Paramecium tetraurelia strain d4-2]